MRHDRGAHLLHLAQTPDPRAHALLDGRRAQIHLTDAGCTLTRDLAQAPRTKFARILAAMPEEQRARILEALTILVEAMREQH
jgi:DNA-binding MarR family transcriptional regulator